MSDNSNDGAHPDDPTVLEPSAPEDELERGELYLGQVRDVREYGVFVAFTPQEMSDVSGLAHKSNLPELTKPRDFSVAEHVAARVDAITSDGPQLVIEYGEAVNPNDRPLPDERPAMSKNPDPGKSGAHNSTPHTVDKEIQRAQRKTIGGAVADGAGTAVAAADSEDTGDDGEAPADTADGADAATASELAEVVDELWALREEIATLKETKVDTEATVLNSGSFAENPLQDTALDLLRLSEADGVEADTVRKEKHADGTVTFEVTINPDVNSEETA